MNLNADVVTGVTIGAGCLASLVMYPDLNLAAPSLQSSLPPALAPPLIAFALPAAAGVTYLILRRLSGESIGGRVIDPESEAAHRAIAARLVLFIMALHVLVVANLGGAEWLQPWGPRLVIVLFGGVFIAIGNLLPRTRPNLAVGIRTARTLSNRDFWIRLHRTCGHVAVALGAVIAVSGLFLDDPALGLVVGTAAIGSIAALAVTYQRNVRV